MAKQTMTNIRGIEALNGNVVLRVYDKGADKDPAKGEGAPVRDKILSIEEAYERAAAMVVIAAKLESREEAKGILDVVKDLMARAGEAKAQRLAVNQDPAVHTL